MVYSVQSCALIGLEAHPVICEVDLSCQLPTLTLVGLASSITQESRERIRAAIQNSGFDWPSRKVTINLLPASLPKWGSHFELAMALGVLGAAGLEPEAEQTFPMVLAVGELSLSGDVRACGWLTAVSDWLVREAKTHFEEKGRRLLLLAHEQEARELLQAAPTLEEVCEVRGVRRLVEAFAVLKEASLRAAPTVVAKAQTQTRAVSNASGFSILSRVREEPLGVIAALVAATGRHHALFAGPHGMGKSMLIQAVCEALSPLSATEMALRASILRTFGERYALEPRRPVVGLQASISRAALEGALHSSGQVLPGELTRAHLGVIVADELLEFRRDVIESFRQPLEDGFVRLQRAQFRTILPAKFQLLASTNLCPCGYHGHQRRLCRCRANVRYAYQGRLSGPILDRFDLIVMVGLRNAAIPVDLQPAVDALLDSKHWAERVAQAQTLESSTELTPAELWGDFWSTTSAELSDRGRLKLARVSRTLAKLLGEPRSAKHLRLALLLRQDLDALLRPQVGDLKEKNPSRIVRLQNI